MVLIVTELPLFRGYFSRNWPLLSQSSGLVTLGVLMIIVGVSILGNLNKEATSQQSLGLSFWQIVISSGVVIVILGVANIVAVSFPVPSAPFELTANSPSFQSYVFRTPSLGVTARMVRSSCAGAPQKVADIIRSPSACSPRRSFQLGRSDTLPSYRQPSPSQPVAQIHRSNTTAYPGSSQSMGRSGLNISAPVNVNHEQFAKFKGSDEVQKPDIAFHPAMYGGRI